MPRPRAYDSQKGPTPKKKDGNCEDQGPRRCFWLRVPQSLKPPLVLCDQFIRGLTENETCSLLIRDLIGLQTLSRFSSEYVSSLIHLFIYQ